MNFIKPTYLYLLLLIPLLLLLYVLKLRRRIYVVSSCLLWEQAIEDMKANTLFQRLRRNLLLPLQVIFLTLAVLALARPFWRGTVDAAQNIILIIDGSASMKATDVGRTRFEAAKSVAEKMVDNLSNGNRMMIIEATSSLRIISGFTADKMQLRNALDEMRPTDTPTDLSSAIQLALSTAKDTRRSEVFLLSDGAGMNMQSLAAARDSGNNGGQIRFIGFGEKDVDNVGITALEVAQSFADPSELQVFISLQNFGNVRKWPLLLELYRDESLIDVRELNLPPRERRSVVFDGIAGRSGGVIKAVIDVDDDLDVDNRAYCILDEPGALKALLISMGNRFLEAAIRTASSRIQLSVEKPEYYSVGAEYDVVIFDGFIPDNLPDRGMIFVNPESDLPFAKMTSYSDDPAIIDWDTSHPVMRFVDLSNLRVDKSANYDMPSWMKPLVESDKGTLAWFGERDGQRIIVLPFEIQPRPSNNLSMLYAFPAFISNALTWLAGIDAESRQVKPGDPIRFSIPATAGDQSVIVKKPDGEEIESRPKDKNIIFADTDQTGIYEIVGTGFSEKFAVSLLDESESDIEPADKIEIAGQEIVSSSISTVSNREIWASLVLVALILLAVEWWVYHRRVLV